MFGSTLQLSELIIALGGAAAVIAGFVRWVVPGIRSAHRWFTRMGQLAEYTPQLIAMPEVAAGMQKSVQHLLREVMPNGNTSMRDAITRIETKVTVMSGTQRVRCDADPLSGYFDADADGYWRWISGTLLDWLDMLPRDAEGMGWLSRVADFDRDRVRLEWRSCIEERREFRVRCMLELHGSEGGQRLVELTAKPILAPIRRDHQQPALGVAQWAGSCRTVGSTLEPTP